MLGDEVYKIEGTYAAIEPNCERSIVWIVAGREEPEPHMLGGSEVRIPGGRVHARGGFYVGMSMRDADIEENRVLPQTPLFSTYLRPRSWDVTSSATVSTTFPRTGVLAGVPPTMPPWTGNSPPNTMVGRAAARIVKGKRIIEGRGSVDGRGRRRAPLVL